MPLALALFIALQAVPAFGLASVSESADASVFLPMILDTLSKEITYSDNMTQEVDSLVWNEASRKWREHGLIDRSFARPDSLNHHRNKKRDGPSWALKECSDVSGLRRHPELSEHIASVVPSSQYRRAAVIEMSRCTVCDMLVSYKQGQLPDGGIVYIMILNDNWGLFSNVITHRTATETTRGAPLKGGGFYEAIESCGKTLGDYEAMLDDPKVLMVVASQHISPSAVHPKLLSIPIGAKSGFEKQIWKAMHRSAHVTKKRLLLINNSGKVFRNEVNTLVIDTFKSHGMHLTNMYNRSMDQKFYDQIAESKFVLCPPGIGHDTYRHWEVLLMGSIPVFESNPGFDRAFKGLPVLIVQSYRDVAPNFLEAVYSNYTSRAKGMFDFRSLAPGFWENLIANIAASGQAIHLDDTLGPWDATLMRSCSGGASPCA